MANKLNAKTMPATWRSSLVACIATKQIGHGFGGSGLGGSGLGGSRFMLPDNCERHRPVNYGRLRNVAR